MNFKSIVVITSILICSNMLSMNGLKVTAGHIMPQQPNKADTQSQKQAAPNPCSGQKMVTEELKKQCKLSEPVGVLKVFRPDPKQSAAPAATTYPGSVSLASVKSPVKAISDASLKAKNLGTIKKITKGSFDFPKAGQKALYAYTPTDGKYKNKELRLLFINTGDVADKLKSWLTIYAQSATANSWQLIASAGSELPDISKGTHLFIHYTLTVDGHIAGEINYNESASVEKRTQFNYSPS